MPGRFMSYEYFARPETFSGPSMRLIRVLSRRRCWGQANGELALADAGAATSATWSPAVTATASSRRRSSATGASLHRERGLEQPHVGAAAADVAVERLARLGGRRVWRLLEQCDGGHHETRRAEAAHRA